MNELLLSKPVEETPDEGSEIISKNKILYLMQLKKTAKILYTQFFKIAVTSSVSLFRGKNSRYDHTLN